MEYEFSHTFNYSQNETRALISQQVSDMRSTQTHMERERDTLKAQFEEFKAEMERRTQRLSKQCTLFSLSSVFCVFPTYSTGKSISGDENVVKYNMNTRIITQLERSSMQPIPNGSRSASRSRSAWRSCKAR